LEGAEKIKNVVNIPVIYIGGNRGLNGISKEKGYMES
jgi:hypothetical protein